MSGDITSIIDRTKLPETSVTLCLDGPLVAEYERLEAKLRDAAPATSLAGDDSTGAIAAQMADLRERMLDAEVPFTFRALSPRRFSGLRGAVPVKQPEQSDEEAAEEYHGWVCKLVSASCVDPVMSAEQADLLCERLSDGQWGALSGAAWSVNTQRQDVPFSAAASVLSRGSGGKSKQPAPSDSPVPDSSAGSLSDEPSTSTTTPVD